MLWSSPQPAPSKPRRGRRCPAGCCPSRFPAFAIDLRWFRIKLGPVTRSAAVLSALAASVLALTCAAPGAPAQTQAAPPAKPAPAAPPADPYRNEAVVFEHFDTTYRMNADGTGQREQHVVVRIQSDGAAQQFGVLAFGYAAATETPSIRYVRVRKPDGSVIETPVSDAMDMAAEVTRSAPLYSDLKEKHLPVRSLSAGDTLEYEVDTTINQPEAPGQFWGAYHFTAPGTFVVLSETLTLEVPSGKYVQVWSPNHKPVITDAHNVRTYFWNVPQLLTAPKPSGDDANKPTPPKDPDEDADGRKLPSIAWTTFHSWAEVGNWYRSLALSRAQPTDALRAEAAALTQKAATPEEQIRALYDYVSGHTRYIGIDFGIGRYQPHSAADVLANQYGDCKDKDTLLEALLRAKGFSTAPALIGAGIAPVPEVPSPAVFNHVITTVNLPGGRIWLDSTPQAAPYQYLSAVIRDQKALVIPADAAASLQTTPAIPPYSFTENFEATATLDADGKLTGKITATYRDDDEVLVRALARNVAPAEWDQASQYISSNTGFGGTTSNTSFQNAENTALPIVLSYTYTRHPYGDWKMLNIVPLFPLTEFSLLDSDTTAPQEDIQLGAPRTLTAECHIHLPDGYRADVPDPVHVKTPFATYDKTYRFEAGQVIVDRTIVILKKKIAKEDWKQYQTFTKDIGLANEPWIPLLLPSKPVTAKVQPPSGATMATANPGQSGKESDTHTVVVRNLPVVPNAAPAPGAPSTPTDASAADLMNVVRERLRAGDLGGAKEALDQVKTKSPNQEYLWSTYGYIASLQRNFAEAEADYQKELAAHPDNERVVGLLAQAQMGVGDSEGARQTLNAFLDKHPNNLQLSLYLGSLETHAQDYNAALKTLSAAADQNPDNRAVRIQLSEALRRLGRNEEAAAAAQSALDGADDPAILNDAAYTLSETGLNLDVAEAACRKSIDALEAKSATITTEQVNSRDFAQANLLVAAWDTYGWILFREGKFQDAKPWLSAAWRSSLRAEVGDHLAQVDEALGNRDEAATQYALAESALTRSEAPDIRQDISGNIARLKAAGAKAGPAGSAALQNLRTYKLKKPAGVSGWGSFRLEITVAGVIESQQMSGQKSIAVLEPALNAMKFPELLPPASKAHLLRSAVISCSEGPECDVVLVPDGSLQTEAQ